MFPSSGEGMELPTLLDPSERANLNHCTRGQKQTQFPKRRVF
jgi:hypothetical protein